MSLYNMVVGVSPLTAFLPYLLGRHAEDFPRYRNCWAIDEERLHEGYQNGYIYVYTRVGGGNREDYEDEIAELQGMTEYVEDYDDDFDCTYATFVFQVPESKQADYTRIIEGKVDHLSDKVKNEILESIKTEELRTSMKEIFYPPKESAV